MFKRISMTLTGVLVCSFSVGLFNLAAFINMFFTGYVVDYSYRFLSSIFPEVNLFQRAVRKKLARRVVPFKWIRASSDLICVALGTLFGKMPGIGTISTAFFMGPLISVFNHAIAEPFGVWRRCSECTS